MHTTKLRILAFCTAVALMAAGAAGAADATPLYSVTKTIPLGTPDHWDYLTFDSLSARLYIAHDATIDVFDTTSGTLLGKVEVPGANGVAVTPGGKGYAGSRKNKTVFVFDTKTFKKLKELPGEEDTDGVIYDAFSKKVFVMNGDPHNMTVIDTGTDAVTTTALHGKPEFAAVDGAGKLYVNIADKREVQSVDTKTGKVVNTWPIPGCESPHGLSMDPKSHRLFVTCVNLLMTILDSDSGKILATLPVGNGSDASAFDAKRGWALSTNGWSGTMTVVEAKDANTYSVLSEVPTHLLARTMALDPATGRVYTVAGERIEVDPTATNPRKRYTVKPNTTQLLYLDPVKAKP
jgi:DNA-binding beta-propeller fold protein YncE